MDFGPIVVALARGLDDAAARFARRSGDVAQVPAPAMVSRKVSALAHRTAFSGSGSARLVVGSSRRRIATLEADHRIAGLSDIMPDLGDRLLCQSLNERKQRRNDTGARRHASGPEADALRRQVEAHKAAHEREQVLRAELEAGHAELEAEHNTVLSSTCWRMTAPLRQAFDRIRRFWPVTRRCGRAAPEL
jgi:hypothetical protein